MTEDSSTPDSDESAVNPLRGSSHVGPVIFADETARTQLVEHGEVVTFRTSDRTTGDTWWRESRTGPKRGDCHIELIDAVCPHGTAGGLAPHADLSGFAGVHEWQQAIRRLHGGMPAEGWLFRVTDEHDGGSR